MIGWYWKEILWMLRTGARWNDLPERYPHPSTCWRRLKSLEEQGICWIFGERFSGNWMNKVFWTGKKPLLTAISLLPKRGLRSRQNQKGQRIEVDGGGRWSRYSAWKPHRFCLAGGSNSDGTNTGARQGPQSHKRGVLNLGLKEWTQTRSMTAIPCGKDSGKEVSHSLAHIANIERTNELRQ